MGYMPARLEVEMSKICHECGQIVPEKAVVAPTPTTQGPFRGDRKETWEAVRTETLRTFFPSTMERPVVVGRIAGHFRCGDQEAEKLLDWMCKNGDIREISPEERMRFDVRFGYWKA